VYTCARVCAVCSLALGDEGGGVQPVSAGHLFLAWGIILTEGSIGVLPVFSLFMTRVRVYVMVSVRVCIRTHTLTLHVGYSDVSPGVGMRHLKFPKDPDKPDAKIHMSVYVYEVHMCIYMLGGGMKS